MRSCRVIIAPRVHDEEDSQPSWHGYLQSMKCSSAKFATYVRKKKKGPTGGHSKRFERVRIVEISRRETPTLFAVGLEDMRNVLIVDEAQNSYTCTSFWSLHVCCPLHTVCRGLYLEAVETTTQKPPKSDFVWLHYCSVSLESLEYLVLMFLTKIGHHLVGRPA
jgi:hypothetical protein